MLDLLLLWGVVRCQLVILRVRFGRGGGALSVLG
jgi:hypothetical protein